MTTYFVPMNDSPALLMADLKAANRAMDRVSERASVETATVQTSIVPPPGFVAPLDPSKDPRWVGPCLRTGTDRHVWAEATWTPEDDIMYEHDPDITRQPAHDSEEYLQWTERLDDLLDKAEREAARCTISCCIEERGPLHTVEDMHASEVEWLCADDGAFGGLVSMNYTLEDGQDGAYLEFTQDTFAGSLDDLAAFADALADVAAQLKVKAQHSPLSAHRD